MFTMLIVQPIFNLLVLIYALVPGHNFGLAIILFTIIVRLLLWPLVKKQLHHAKAMRLLQPEVNKIKKATKDKQEQNRLVMELYKEREINPLSSLGIIAVQLPILIGLYSGLRKIITNPHSLLTFSYGWVHNLPWMHTLAGDIHKFDNTLFGLVDLSKMASGHSGGIYWPAMVLVTASAIMQFFQSKQLMPQDKEARSLRQILKEAGRGKPAEQQEVNAAVGRGTVILIPAFVFIISIGLASALSLYWLVTAVVAYIQQSMILKDDGIELTNSGKGNVIDVEPIDLKDVDKTKKDLKTKPKKLSSSKKTKKRRR